MPELKTPYRLGKLRELLSEAQTLVAGASYTHTDKMHILDALTSLKQSCDEASTRTDDEKPAESISASLQGIVEETPSVALEFANDAIVTLGTVDIGSVRCLIILKGSVKDELSQLKHARSYVAREIARLERP
jgi:hypothetical protein